MAPLSKEILDQICNTVDLSTLPNFRLACRIFAAVGAQYLFEELHLTYCPSESFTKFRAVSEHKILCQHVKSILYQGDWLTMEDKSRIVNCRNPQHSCRALIDGRDIDRARARSIFLAAINRLPNLKTVILALAMPVRENIHEERNRWRYCHPPQELFRMRASAQFGFLLGYIQSNGVLLRCLRLGTVQSMDFETTTDFQHLQRLDLALPSKLFRDDYARLSQLLNSVPDLRMLNLGLTDKSPTWESNLRLENAIDSCSMPNLTFVTFAHIHVRSDKLLSFFRRHTQVLKDVRLEEILVTISHVMISDVRRSGSLEDFVEQMQGVLSLERIYVTGEFITSSGKCMILGPRSRQGQSLRRLVERYLMEVEPSPFAVAGIEFGVSSMRTLRATSAQGESPW